MAENMIRRMLQIETAVERCPSRPDFTGLDVVDGNMITELGAVRVPKFRKFVSGRQRERNSIFTQERVAREEQAHQVRARGGGNDGTEGKG